MKYLLLFLLLFAGVAHTEDASDSDLVHGLAHGGAGAMVAMATDVGPMNFARLGYKNSGHTNLPWYLPIAIETCMALVVDELYEVNTEKTPCVLAQHNLDAAVGGALYSMRLSLQF